MSNAQGYKDILSKLHLPQPGNLINTNNQRLKNITPAYLAGTEYQNKLFSFKNDDGASLYGNKIQEISLLISASDTILEIEIITKFDSTTYDRIIADLGRPELMVGWDGIDDANTVEERLMGTYGWRKDKITYWIHFRNSDLYLGQEPDNTIVYTIRLRQRQ